jgi:C-terminal processing protease CtpA/Prc
VPLVLASAAAAAEPQADAARVARLVGLARVWGYVKYVHPALATSSLDWDAALVRALPAVEGARSDAEYRQAIAGLLAELGDPATTVVDPAAAPGAPPAIPPAAPAAAPAAIRLEAVDAKTALLAIPNDPAVESPELEAELCARLGEAVRSERVIVDLRGRPGRAAGWRLRSAFVRCAGRLLARDVTLPPARYLTHGFYMMQSVAGGAGGGLGPWESGVTVASAGAVRGEGQRTPRLAAIANRDGMDVFPLLMALQDEGLAAVVQEGDVPAAGVMVASFEVDGALQVAVRHGDRLRADGRAGFVADAVVPASSVGAAPDVALGKAIALLDAARPAPAPPGAPSLPFVAGALVEKDYSETPYPDRAHRLLALFRLFNVVEYFFPYRDLMDRPWRETLAEFVPRMADARDATGYALAVSELAVRLQDSHVTLASPVLDAYFGTHRPDVRVDRVEGQTVITGLAPTLAKSGVRVGDVVVSVDGEEASVRRARLARYLPASTPGRLENKIDVQFLLGPRARPAVIEARGADGTVRRLEAARTIAGLAPRARPRTGPTHTVLPSGFGYVDLERLEARDVPAAWETIARTPGTIFDMRGYPTGGAWAVAAGLAKPGAPPGALGGSVRYDGTSGTFSVEEGLANLEPAENGPAYAGRVVVLADGSSQSAAEHVCLLIKSAGPATIVGSPTSGANGGVTRTILPGGIVVNFSGQSVRHRDGTRLQRVGIVPDVEAHPTLAGVRAGRDDVLERAIEVLRAEPAAR